MKILLITDSADKLLNNILINYEEDKHYYLHTINKNVEGVLQNIRSHQKYNNIKINAIDNSQINKLAENEAREYYIKWIRDFPNDKLFNNKSLSELLKKNNRNYWWYFPISEKNIWTDKIIHRLFEIKRLIKILKNNKYEKIYCQISDKILQDTFYNIATNNNVFLYDKVIKYRISRRYFELLTFGISYTVNATKIFASVLIKKLLLFYKASANKPLIPDSIGFFSLFPLFWKDLKTDKPRDIFLNSLSYEMSKKYNVTQFIWLSSWKRLLINRGCLSNLKINNKTYILDNNITIIDALSIFNLNIFLILLSILACKNRNNIGSIEGIKIDHIIYDELFRSFSSATYFQALLIDIAFQKVPLTNLRTLIYRLEFQPHERSLLYNTNERVRTVGFQHSALSNNFLNYVFKEDELKTHLLNQNDSQRMPLPGYIFTSGAVGFEYMSHAGYPDNRICIVGGVRFSEIYEYNKRKSSKADLRLKYNIPKDKYIIFAPTSLFVDETINMLDSLLYSIKDSQRNNYLIIKLHPASVTKTFSTKIRHFLDANWQNNSYCLIKESINTYDYILLSDVAIFLGGSMAIEAMSLGEKPFIYLTNNHFIHNPISNYLDSVSYAFNRSSMQKAFNSSGGKTNDKNAQKAVRDMFGELKGNPYEIFINKIDLIYNGVI